MAQWWWLNKLGVNPESINKSTEQNDTALNDLWKLSGREVAVAFTNKINNPARIWRWSDIERKWVTPIKVDAPIIAQNDINNNWTSPWIDTDVVTLESITDSNWNVNAESVIAVN